MTRSHSHAHWKGLHFLTVPGLHGSGPGHWQSRWEARFPAWGRVTQADWTRPSLPIWAAAVGRAVRAAPRQVVLVAHSFGCLASLRWALTDPAGIAGALLVAPAEPDKFAVADQLPVARLPFPTVVVASRDDPWMQQRNAFTWGTLWGSELVDVGRLGHINADSGLGDWEDGLGLLGGLVQRIEGPAALQPASERAPAWAPCPDVSPVPYSWNV